LTGDSTDGEVGNVRTLGGDRKTTTRCDYRSHKDVDIQVVADIAAQYARKPRSWQPTSADANLYAFIVQLSTATRIETETLTPTLAIASCQKASDL